MRIIVTGAAGQLGSDVVRVCRAAGDEVLALDRSTLDVTHRDQVLGSVLSMRPDAIVNCAAFTAVDRCESESDTAFGVNALAVRWLREAADLSGSHLVQVSTDYVFDGTLDRPYTEWDETGPRSVYGQSKLAGEREAGEAATIVRTSWVCGAVGANMVKTVLRLASQHTELSFVDDQIGCPTFTADLAVMLRRLALDRRSGVHHVTNQGAVSWYGFVREILMAAGHDADMVRPVATADLVPPRPAPRPANSVLDNVVLRSGGLGVLRDFREPLGELVTQLAKIKAP